MATDITQFRADFRAMFAYWRRIGKLSEVEAMKQYQDAARAVQYNMHDDDWLAAAAAHFRRLVLAVEADDERRARIVAEIAQTRAGGQS